MASAEYETCPRSGSSSSAQVISVCQITNHRIFHLICIINRGKVLGVWIQGKGLGHYQYSVPPINAVKNFDC